MRSGLGFGVVGGALLAGTVAGAQPAKPVGTTAEPAKPANTMIEVTRGREQSLGYEQQVPLRVEFRNEFPDRFRLNQFQLLIDGQVVSEMSAGRDGELQRTFLAHQAEVPAGLHAVEVRAVLVGRSSGLFDYMENYRLHVRSSRAIEPEAGKQAVLTVVMEKQGGWTSPIEQQVALRFEAAPGLGINTPVKAQR